MVHIIWSILYGPYYMIYGPYLMVLNTNSRPELGGHENHTGIKNRASKLLMFISNWVRSATSIQVTDVGDKFKM